MDRTDQSFSVLCSLDDLMNPVEEGGQGMSYAEARAACVPTWTESEMDSNIHVSPKTTTTVSSIGSHTGPFVAIPTPPEARTTAAVTVTVTTDPQLQAHEPSPMELDPDRSLYMEGDQSMVAGLASNAHPVGVNTIMQNAESSVRIPVDADNQLRVGARVTVNHCGLPSSRRSDRAELAGHTGMVRCRVPSKRPNAIEKESWAVHFAHINKVRRLRATDLTLHPGVCDHKP